MKTRYKVGSLPCRLGSIEYLEVVHDTRFRVLFHEGRCKNAFIMVTSGRLCYHFFDGSSSDLITSPGEAVFIPAAARHSSTYELDGSAVRIFEFEIESGSPPDYLIKPFKFQSRAASDVFSSIGGDKRFDTLFLLSRFYELLHIVSERERMTGRFAKLSPALDELHRAPSDNRPIADYAALCGMSEPCFRRLFTACTSRSPIVYRNELRLTLAKHYIETGEYSIAESADMAGFTNLSFFYRLYKRTFGCSPGSKDKDEKTQGDTL